MAAVPKHIRIECTTGHAPPSLTSLPLLQSPWSNRQQAWSCDHRRQRRTHL